MTVRSVEFGIHTIELYANQLKYIEVQKVIDHLVEKKAIQLLKRDSYNIDRQLKSAYLIKDGIRLRIYQSHDKANGIGFALNPSTLLGGAYAPVALYCPQKNTWKTVMSRFKDALARLHLDKEIDDLSLSSMELTMNIWLDDDADLPALIRTFWKSNLPHHFKRVPLEDKNKRDVNHHYFCARAGDVTIKAYDKIYELNKFHRCPKKLCGRKLLRVELSIKREAFLKKLDLDRTDSKLEMLCAGYKSGEELLADYLLKLFPCSGAHVRYKDAQKALNEDGPDGLLQEQMQYLLEKTSGGAGLDTAVRKLKERYKGVDDRRLKKLWATFDKLNINPITLPNSYPMKRLPALVQLLNDM